MEGVSTGADPAGGGGGIWNWDDLPQEVQDQFHQTYFMASQPAYQALEANAAQKAQQS